MVSITIRWVDIFLEASIGLVEGRVMRRKRWESCMVWFGLI
jgi:hypothetical protein